MSELQPYPYTQSGGEIEQVVTKFRSRFPSQVTSPTIKQLGISHSPALLVKLLHWLGLIDAEGSPTAQGKDIFSRHTEADFQKGFEEIVKQKYQELFDLHGDEAWTLHRNDLISFFREADHTSMSVGEKQAATFATLAVLAGRREQSNRRTRGSSSRRAKPKKVSQKSRTVKPTTQATEIPSASESDVSLTVRIEINLPSGGDQETYDHIFKSIRDYLLNG